MIVDPFGSQGDPQREPCDVRGIIAAMPKKPSTTAPVRARKVAKTVEPASDRVGEARRPLTRASWIDAATEVLVDHGVGHVRIDVLAVQLGVTRGSFYWHFRDRDDLLNQVLVAWSSRTTEQLTMRLARAHDDPRRQIADLISLPFRGRSARRIARIELAIRSWARRDAAAREAVDRSDASRLAYHERLFAALGFGRTEARSRAFLLYGYEIAESLMHGQGSAAERKRRAAFVERLVRHPLGADAGAARELGAAVSARATLPAAPPTPSGTARASTPVRTPPRS